jgi:hypothetical protein
MRGSNGIPVFIGAIGDMASYADTSGIEYIEINTEETIIVKMWVYFDNFIVLSFYFIFPHLLKK